VGRLPVAAVLEELTAGDLYDILHNPNNPIITSKKRDFWAYGINVSFEDQALRLLAEQAALEKTGARGLVSVIERVLIQFEKRLPSTDIKEFVVTPEVVRQPEAELARLLNEPGDPGLQARFREAARLEREILKEFIWRRERELRERYRLPLTDTRVDLMADHYHQWDCDLKTCFDEMGRLHEQVLNFEDRFFAEHDIQLHFDDDAVDEILRQALEGETSAYAVCEQLAGDLEYALKLVRDRTSRDHFILNREALGDLDTYLNRVIQEHYQTTLFRE
jgi:ATP-dependent protease Clp ATPase subunit